MYDCHQLSFSKPKMRNVHVEPKRAKRIQPFRYLLLDQPAMRVCDANYAFCICHLLPMSWPCLLPMSGLDLPKDREVLPGQVTI